MLRSTPLKEVMFQKYLVQVRGWREKKICMRGWRWGYLAPTVSWLYSLSVIIVTTQHQHPPSPRHLLHHHTGLLVSTTFPKPIFAGYSTIDRFPYPFIHLTPEIGNPFWEEPPCIGHYRVYRPPGLACRIHFSFAFHPTSSLELEFYEMRFAHSKKMPVKKYPYAPTLVYFADKHLCHRIKMMMMMMMMTQRSMGAGVFSPSPPPNQNLARACKAPDALVLKNTFTDVFNIGDFRAHIFCPQTTQELPKKHHEVGAHLMGSCMKLGRRNNCLLTHYGHNRQ